MDAAIVRRADYYYVGTFDDEILRYNKTNLDLAKINETLSQAALFGGPLLINDGYLMMYHDGRRALVDRTVSPLLDLIDQHYVRLFSRNGGRLAEMPLAMQHIPTYRDLVRSPEWANFEPQLEELQAYLKQNNAFENWPQVNLGPGFQRLVNLVFQGLDLRSLEGYLTDKQADRLLGEFNSLIKADPKLPARTIWTQTYERPDLEISESGRSFLHWLGIEAYHYNLAMASCLNDSARRPGVVTRYSNLFENLRGQTLSRTLNGAKFPEIPTPALPRGIPVDALHKGAFLTEVVKFGTSLYYKKKAYLDAAQAALNDRNALPEVRLAADNYGTSLARALSSADTYHKNAESILQPLDIVTTTAGAGGTRSSGLPV